MRIWILTWRHFHCIDFVSHLVLVRSQINTSTYLAFVLGEWELMTSLFQGLFLFQAASAPSPKKVKDRVYCLMFNVPFRSNAIFSTIPLEACFLHDTYIEETFLSYFRLLGLQATLCCEEILKLIGIFVIIFKNLEHFLFSLSSQRIIISIIALF